MPDGRKHITEEMWIRIQAACRSLDGFVLPMQRCYWARPVMKHVVAKPIVLWTYRHFPTAVRLLRYATEGASRPVYIECDDGRSYVVKFQPEDPGVGLCKAPCNEWISSVVGKEMGLSLPNFSMIWVPPDFVDVNPSLSRESPPKASGLHFGVEVIPDSQVLSDLVAGANFGTLRLFQSIENKEALTGALVFDTWLFNIDRNNPGNNLFQVQPDVGRGTRFKYYQIDHGHTFSGADWDEGVLAEMAPHPYAADGLRRLPDPIPEGSLHALGVRPGCFQPWVARMQSTWNSGAAFWAINNLPPRWGIVPLEKLGLRDFMDIRRGMVEQLLTARFPISKFRMPEEPGA